MVVRQPFWCPRFLRPAPQRRAARQRGPAPNAKATFTVGITEDADSLNPFTGITVQAYEAWQVMYDHLIGYGQKDFSPVPQLATAWVESPDHSTWTYTIRSGVKWSDGVAADRRRRRVHLQPDHRTAPTSRRTTATTSRASRR